MRIAAGLLCLLLLAATAQAADVSLAWDQSVSPNLAGNKVYVGVTSRTYGPPITIPLQTEYTVTNLAPGATYYFAVTAYDADANESDFSNEVFEEIVGPPAFVITSSAASLRWFGVVCLATTSAPASAVFQYQKIEAGAGWTSVIATPTATKTEHRAVLYLPKDGAYYRYRWIATDAAGDIDQASSTFQVR